MGPAIYAALCPFVTALVGTNPAIPASLWRWHATEERRDQMFPKLDAVEIERVRRFGDLGSFGAGQLLGTIGQITPGLVVILSGKVAVTERDPFDNHQPIVSHGPGNFLGEVAQLAGRPALVQATAEEPWPGAASLRAACRHARGP
jgi:hypothetical protein